MADIVWQNIKHAGPGSPDIVWQYLYHMKLVSLLKEDGQDENLPKDENQPLDPQIETYNQITEPILKFLQEMGWRNNRIQHKDGMFSLSYYQHLKPEQYKTDDWGFIKIGVYFIPNINNPAVPLDVISEPYKYFIEHMSESIPEVLSEFSRVEFNRIKLKLGDVHIKTGYALYNLSELIGRALYNQKIRGVEIPLGDLLIDGLGITEELILDETEMPKFDPNFKKIHDKAVKRATTVVKAYQKGKWRGHTYDLGDNGNGKVDILLLDFHKEPVVKDGVIRPLTKVHLQLPSPIMDGYNRWSDKEQYPLSDDELKDFYKFMNNKIFNKFGIVY